MDIVQRIVEVRERVTAARRAGKTIGFVPTMGYLHEGHLSLVAISKQQTDYQVMSIFVNRIQFNDPKDFESYPSDLQRDFDLAEENGVDLIFIPTDTEMYHEHLTYVDVEKITEHLCGSSRPGHFRGVFTVVSKLFNIISPDVSVFGQKDIQQAISIEKMVFDLNFPVKIIIAPIIREEDGLALSSRNKHLTTEERRRALVISQSLKEAERLIHAGEAEGDVIRTAMRTMLESGEPEHLDYITLVNYADLQPIERLTPRCIIAVAAFFGKTRLIDNMIIEKTEGGYRCIY
jgi:pantoate--beta-alanine ligase